MLALSAIRYCPPRRRRHMRHIFRFTHGIPAALAVCFVATCMISSSPAANDTSGENLTLAPPVSPASVSTPAEYNRYLDTRLTDLQDRLRQAKQPAAQARACLELASFALTRGTEPALSYIWLGIPRAKQSEAAPPNSAPPGRPSHGWTTSRATVPVRVWTSIALRVKLADSLPSPTWRPSFWTRRRRKAMPCRPHNAPTACVTVWGKRKCRRGIC